MTPPFATLMADPPWPFEDALPGNGRGAAKHYRLLSMPEIFRYPLPPIADNAVLFLWRVASMPQEALDVIRVWGFTPKSEIIWRKTTVNGLRHMGMGRIIRAEHETCIVAVRGAPPVKSHGTRSVFDAASAVPSLFEASVGRHSAKPERIYEIAEELFDGPFLSVFDRRERAGWTCIGDEVARAVPYAGASQLTLGAIAPSNAAPTGEP